MKISKHPITYIALLLLGAFLVSPIIAAAGTHNIYTATTPKPAIEAAPTIEATVYDNANFNPSTGGYWHPPTCLNVSTTTLENSAVKIEFIPPEYTSRSAATVKVNVAPTPKAIYYRLSDRGDWQDITDTAAVQVTSNTFIFLKVIDSSDNEVLRQSEYIECFDRKAPTFTTAFQSDSRITITAKDDISGVKAIYINDEIIYSNEFDSSSDDGKLVTYIHNIRGTDSVVIQVEDEAGNISKTDVVSSKKNSSTSNSNDSTPDADSNSGKIGNAKITILPPNWTNQKQALVKVEVDGKNIESIQAKIGRDGQWFRVGETMDFVIKKNCEVYVKAIDTESRSTVSSAAVFCFDYNAPKVKAVQDGDSINITVEDDLSGVVYVYVNGKPYVTDAAGGLSVSIDEKASFVIQAKDEAGNISKILTISPDNSNATPTQEVPYNEQATGKNFYISIGGTDHTIEELQKLGLPIYIFPEADEETIKAILYARGDEIFMDNTGIVLDRHMLYKETFDDKGNKFWIDRKGNIVLFDHNGNPIIWDGDWTSQEWFDIDGNLILWNENGKQISHNNSESLAISSDSDDPEVISTSGEVSSKKSKSIKNIVTVALVFVIGGIFLLITFLNKREKASFDPEDLYETEHSDDEDENSEYSEFDNFSSDADNEFSDS